ncbi:DHA2 family efflux MFS transporter permease subunit [Allocatelliglobosispora scoriae]
MVVLDATVVNIALPQAQAELGITDANRQWVLTAYTLAFGGLLLLGGRIADYWGRRRAFVLGAIGFAVASAIGGLAQSGEMLFAARALQGVFGALLAPAGLALLTGLFTEAKERAKAFAVYGAIAGGGAAIGLVLGGVLTQYADWRWCLLVNIPIALIAVFAALAVVPESRAHGDTKYDVPGAVTATLGLVSLVYGFTQAADKGWSDSATLSFIAGGLVLLAAFVIIELRSRNPLLPMRIILDRNRGGAYLFSMMVGIGLMGAFLFLALYFQIVLQYTPLESGLAMLPVTAGVFIAAGLATQLAVKFGPKPLMVAGGLIAASGMLYLTQIGLDTAFVTHVLPAELLLGLGLGFSFVPLSSLALVGVPEHDAGAASATLNATQQIGGSLGVALLSTIATTAVTSWSAKQAVQGPMIQFQALVHSYQVVFAWGAGFLALGAVIAAFIIKATKDDLPTDVAAVHMG